jgi:3-hydroxyacyl-CoA dehydrogenase
MFARAGFLVSLYDIDPTALAQALAAVGTHLETLHKGGLMDSPVDEVEGP